MAHIVGMTRSDELFIKKNLEWLIAAARTNAHLVAEATGVPQPTIHRILSGESKDPRTSTLVPLADYFGVGVAELRDKDLSQGPAPETADAGRSKRQVREEVVISDVVRVAIICHELPLDFRKRLLDFAEGLKAQDADRRGDQVIQKIGGSRENQ